MRNYDAFFKVPLEMKSTTQTSYVTTTVQDLRITLLNKERLDASEYIILFAHGMDVKPTTYLVQAQAYASITNLPTITFTFNDTWRRLNFAQATDKECLDKAYRFVRINFPNKKIILAGLSRGASTIIKFLTTDPENVSAAIIESPWDTIEHLSYHIAHSYLKYLPGSKKLLHKLVRLFPNVNDSEPEVIEYAQQLTKTVPLLIAYSTEDKVIAPTATQAVLNALTMNNNLISICKLNTGTHGKLYKIEQLQECIKAFITSLQPSL